jgi:hypothetical protein
MNRHERRRLEPDRAELERFVKAVLPYVDEGTFVSLRSFEHGAGTKPFAIKAVRVNGGLDGVIDAAARMAGAAAGARNGVVFAPPISTFANPNHAAEADLANGPTLSVECDAGPTAARQKLEGLLGAATVVVASGGDWTDPATGEVQPKLHLHWRLPEPTRTSEEHARLKLARKLAALLIGGDPTATPLVHPLRWPGSWHRKGKPKLCRIVALNESAELDLAEALERLEAAAKAAGLSLEKIKANGAGEDRDTAELIRLITTGTEYLGPLVALSARYAGRGMSANQIGQTLRGFLEAVPETVRDMKDGQRVAGRWADRVANLARMARSAVEKYGQKSAEPDREPGTKAPEADRQSSGTVTRAEIRLTIERWNDTLRQCAGLLTDVIYMRDTKPMLLVRAAEASGVEMSDKDGPAVEIHGVRYRPGSLILIEATTGRVAWQLDERTTFSRWVRRDEKWIATTCPKDAVASSIVENALDHRFRACAGIVRVPLLIGGKIIALSGYHASTGLILDLAGPSLTIPKVLTLKVAQAALARLLKPWRGFIEHSGVSRTAIAAAALTAVLRPSLATAPMILIDGNVPGCGKGKLGRGLGALATGNLPTLVTEGHSEEEMEKRISAAVLQGSQAILLDNLQRQLNSSTLESILTEVAADIRGFGRLELLKVLCRALVLVTANNASVRADMLRRALRLRIVAETDKPELRSCFDFDPVEEVLRDRQQLLEAAFTVALAWEQARNLPENQKHRKPLGSFEDWADRVAGAVSWLTGLNPIDLIEENKDSNPRAMDERRLLEALAEWQKGLRDTHGRERRYWYASEAATGLGADLWAGVLEFKGDRPTAKQVGRWLTRKKDAVFGDYILTGSPDRKETMEWTCRVCRVSPGFSHPSREDLDGDGHNPNHVSGVAANPAKPGKPGKKPKADEPEGEDVW